MACSPGHVLERPGVGVHSRAFTRKHGADNWESQNALTICLEPGTRVIAVGDGEILTTGYGPWRVQGARQGQRLHLRLRTGETFFYGYLSSLAVERGAKVKDGQLLGRSGYVRGRGALHFAAKPQVSPWAWYGSAWLPAGASGPQPSPGAGAQPGGGGGGPDAPDNSVLPQAVEDAWHDLEFAFRVTLPTQDDRIGNARQAIRKQVFS